MSSTAAAALRVPSVPYRGIEPFRYLDQPIFFARGAETEELLRYVAIYRGVLLYGDSGSGKSSLINAGLIPAVMAEGFAPDRLRVQPREHEEIIVERISVAADGHPPYLPSNFAADQARASRVVFSVTAFRDSLRRLPTDCRPLLIFDQFEEFVTLFERASHERAMKEALAAQAEILGLLVELIRSPSLPVKLLLVFREDYLAKFAKLFALCPNLPDQRLRLTPLRVETLPTIIRGPFEKFPGHFKKELPPALVDRLAEEIARRSEVGTLSLSEVQIACLRLWQSSDPAAQFEQRGVQGLLEDYLSDSLNRLSQYLRDPAVALLSRMVTSSGTRNVISEGDLITLVHKEDGTSAVILREALEALERDTKLVRRERRHDTNFFEIVSEFLIPWISEQKAARLAQSERRKKRRAYALAGASLLLALVAVMILWYTWKTRQDALNAQLNRLRADEQVRLANIATDTARKETEQVKKEKDILTKQLEQVIVQATLARSDVRELEATVKDLNDWAKNFFPQDASSPYFPRDGFSYPERAAEAYRNYPRRAKDKRGEITVRLHTSDADGAMTNPLASLNFTVKAPPPYAQAAGAKANTVIYDSNSMTKEDVLKVVLTLMREGVKVTTLEDTGEGKFIDVMWREENDRQPPLSVAAVLDILKYSYS